MSRKRKLACALLAPLILSVPMHDIVRAAPAGEMVRVGLVRFYKGVGQVTVTSGSGIALANANGEEIVSGEAGAEMTLSAEGGVVTVRSGLGVYPSSGPYVTASPHDPASTVRIACLRQPARDYRGAIEVRPRPWGLLLVNVVPVEDYLIGVVPEEMPSGYPLEAIKAQAVTARTYALGNHSKHASEGYDLCDYNNCQTYGGVAAEKPRTTEAVNATRGLVLTYGGKIASVMYSTDCGGVTQDSSETRPNSKIPYLASVTEPTDIAHCSWELSFALQELEAKLIAAGIDKAAGLTGVRVSKTGASGRAIELEITGENGAATISGLALRNALGPRALKSLLFTIEASPDGGVTFKGKGFGHGVGLCQVGARGLASPPRSFTFQQILAHYFPGAEVDVGAKHSDDAASASGKTGGPNASPLQNPTVRQNSTASSQRKAEVKPAPAGQSKQSQGQSGVTFDVRLDAPDGL